MEEVLHLIFGVKLNHVTCICIVLTIVYSPHVAQSSACLFPTETCCLRQGSIGQRDGDSGPPGETKYNMHVSKVTD